MPVSCRLLGLGMGPEHQTPVLEEKEKLGFIHPVIRGLVSEEDDEEETSPELESSPFEAEKTHKAVSNTRQSRTGVQARVK